MCFQTGKHSQIGRDIHITIMVCCGNIILQQFYRHIDSLNNAEVTFYELDNFIDTFPYFEMIMIGFF